MEPSGQLGSQLFSRYLSFAHPFLRLNGTLIPLWPFTALERVGFSSEHLPPLI